MHYTKSFVKTVQIIAKQVHEINHIVVAAGHGIPLDVYGLRDHLDALVINVRSVEDKIIFDKSSIFNDLNRIIILAREIAHKLVSQSLLNHMSQEITFFKNRVKRYAAHVLSLKMKEESDIKYLCGLLYHLAHKLRSVPTKSDRLPCDLTEWRSEVLYSLKLYNTKLFYLRGIEGLPDASLASVGSLVVGALNAVYLQVDVIDNIQKAAEELYAIAKQLDSYIGDHSYHQRQKGELSQSLNHHPTESAGTATKDMIIPAKSEPKLPRVSPPDYAIKWAISLHDLLSGLIKNLLLDNEVIELQKLISKNESKLIDCDPLQRNLFELRHSLSELPRCTNDHSRNEHLRNINKVSGTIIEILDQVIIEYAENNIDRNNKLMTHLEQMIEETQSNLDHLPNDPFNCNTAHWTSYKIALEDVKRRVYDSIQK